MSESSSADMPKFQCEEFSDQDSSWLSSLEDTWEPVSDAETNRTPSEGLCSDCENREDCAWRIPEGGVWHCEEYC